MLTQRCYAALAIALSCEKNAAGAAMNFSEIGSSSVPGGVATLIVALLVVAVLILAVLRSIRRRRARSVRGVVKKIAFEYLSELIIPNADGGEIQVDHLILTAEGLLVVDVKEVRGKVFGSDKMQEWTVINSDRRFTFPNPQPALYDRIAAVKQIVRQVPVAGRILFLDEAEFTKGVPSMVSSIDDLLSEYGEVDRVAAKAKIEAFRPHWEQVLSVASGAPSAASEGGSAA